LEIADYEEVEAWAPSPIDLVLEDPDCNWAVAAVLRDALADAAFAAGLPVNASTWEIERRSPVLAPIAALLWEIEHSRGGPVLRPPDQW
jgi:hypothetical protein